MGQFTFVNTYYNHLPINIKIVNNNSKLEFYTHYDI